MDRTDAIEIVNVTIASGASLSNSVSLNGHKDTTLSGLRLFGIVMPAAWTAANITFQSSYDGGTTWNDVYLDGSEYVYAAAAGKDNNVDIQRFSCVPMIRLRSGTSGTPVNQAGDRIIMLILRIV